MKRFVFGFLFAIFATKAQAIEDIQIGLANETVSITSNFIGSEVVVFGSVEGADPRLLDKGEYHIVVVLVGPRENVTVRRKERKLGIWINGAAQEFRNVPLSYSLASTAPLNEIADEHSLKFRQLGFKNLNIESTGVSRSPIETEQFRDSLQRLKSNGMLYSQRDDGVQFLSPSLFRAQLFVPANVPIGLHTAQAYLFHAGKFKASKSATLDVRKDGFEQITYDMAHENGLLYGIIAVLIAIATGWLASVVFRKE